MSTCTFCDKKYTRKTSYNRHVILCEIMHQTKRERLCDSEESDNLPTYKQLYNIVQELGLKYVALENKMEEMQKWVNQKKKKINILDWLNNNETTTSYSDWISAIAISSEEIEILQTESLIKTFMTVLQNNLNKSVKTHPITAFLEKANTLYFYHENEWKQLESNDLVLLVKKIHSKIFGSLVQWKKDNHEKIKYDDKWGELYNKTLLKLTSINFTHDSAILCKIKTGLYNYLKTELKQILTTEYNFT